MNKKIIRVFPERTSYTPDDDMVFIGEPSLFIPYHDEVHISCTFTWNMDYCEYLKCQWEGQTDKPVKLGGIAYGDKPKGKNDGMYLKKNIVFTSRGCNNKCRFCIVPKIEGRLIELDDFGEGNIIQDNNFLQCSREHKEKVFEMLKSQKNICFKGGLQCSLIDEHFCENIKKLSIKEVWLACDSNKTIPAFLQAVDKLHNVAQLSQRKIHCYVLCGDDMKENEQRLRTVYQAGAMPFCQLFQPYERKKIEYSKEWKEFHRFWSRPAIYETALKLEAKNKSV